MARDEKAYIFGTLVRIFGYFICMFDILKKENLKMRLYKKWLQPKNRHQQSPSPFGGCFQLYDLTNVDKQTLPRNIIEGFDSKPLGR